MMNDDDEEKMKKMPEKEAENSKETKEKCSRLPCNVPDKVANMLENEKWRCLRKSCGRILLQS